MKYIQLVAISFSLVSLIAHAVPPDPPAGMRWVLNETFSDEFNGSVLDDEKWYDYHPKWAGREPGLFVPENVSLGDGLLRLKGGVLEQPKNISGREYTISCAAVTSKSYAAYYGYYECRLKAGASTLSTTFWLSTRATGDGPEAGNDRYGLELDIQECIGQSGDFDGNKMSSGMNSNTHFWYTDTSGEKHNLAAPADVESDALASEDFNTYGCWWRDASQASFYYNDSDRKNVDFYSGIKENPFDLKMAMNLVCETYPSPWITLPTESVLLDPERNTCYYDWVRTYDLVDVDAVVPAASYDIFPEFVRIDEAASRASDWKSLFVVYSSNQREALQLELTDRSGRVMYQTACSLEPGLGTKEIQLLNPGVLNESADYRVRVSCSGAGSAESVFSVYEAPVAPAIQRIFVWTEDFDDLALGVSSGNNQTLAGSTLKTLNTLSGEVVTAPAAFSSAWNHAFRLSTSSNDWSKIQSDGSLDFSDQVYGEGDLYRFSFDLYLPDTLTYAVGDIQLKWVNKANESFTVSDSSAVKRAAGVWHLSHLGTFPLRKGESDYWPTGVQASIRLDQDGVALADFAYVDNIELVIEPPEITQTTIWEEDFDSAAIGAIAVGRLAGADVETANTLAGEVVAAPESFTSAAGHTLKLDTGTGGFATLRSVDHPIDLSGYNLKAGDCYALSFDLYIPEDLAAPIGSVGLDWQALGQTSRTVQTDHAVWAAGVHRVVCTGTFPVGDALLYPSSVYPQIYFDQDGVAASEVAYVDHVKFEIGPAGSNLEGFDRFEYDYALQMGPWGDDDGDGVLNATEYAFGGHPMNGADSGFQPTGRWVQEAGKNEFQYKYRRSKEAYHGLTYGVQTSTNLNDWVDRNESILVESESAAYEIITEYVPVTGNKLFMRVRVSAE